MTLDPRTIDPRTPVLIGVAQVVEHLDDPLVARHPAALMADAVREAARDAGLRGLPAIDSLRVVALLSCRYANPGRAVARELGLEPHETAVTTMGGNSPQSLVNTTAAAIRRGELDLAILTGGEAARSRRLARAGGIDLGWPTYPDDDPPAIIGDELEMSHPIERAHGVMMPVQIYPMFETALRAAAGRSPAAHTAHIAALWSRFSAVAADNPHAWSRVRRSADEIATPTPTNRMIGLPYTKYMNSNNDVDMAATLVMCSAERARSLGVAPDRWVFPQAGVDCHEHDFVSHRWTFTQTPAIELGARAVLELAGTTIDDVGIVDLYSCFPSAVQLGAASIGLAPDVQLTRTGGLPFAGGPWNNYVMHAIATIVDELRRSPDATALVWANGGFATKHSFGIYRTTPPAAGFRHTSPQGVIDALPRRVVDDEIDAPVTIEAYTVMHDRDGRPEQAIATCLTADGRRTWATSAHADVTSAMCEGEWVGTRIRRTADGGLHP
ncbi:MAG: acetyl-CoA acetyltransferase [Ilumatobacteraceae bacterium]